MLMLLAPAVVQDKAASDLAVRTVRNEVASDRVTVTDPSEVSAAKIDLSEGLEVDRTTETALGGDLEVIPTTATVPGEDLGEARMMATVHNEAALVATVKTDHSEDSVPLAVTAVEDLVVTAAGDLVVTVPAETTMNTTTETNVQTTDLIEMTTDLIAVVDLARERGLEMSKADEDSTNRRTNQGEVSEVEVVAVQDSVLLVLLLGMSF